ncbi:DUF2798 domain-containing protein [Acidovorax facilis]|uniref:DUF2798 domain-containing protein n=1 Tax=Acidovorax facilis TaxID=12917 RepID=UPI003CECBC0D
MNQPSSPRTSASSSSKTFFGLRKLPARSAAWVTPLLLSLLMTFIVSLISTVRVAGFSLDLPRLWLSAWALSWVVAFPTLLLVLPVVRRITAAIVEQPR